MTVPDCKENTKWIISKNILKISEAQLSKLRDLKTNDYDVDFLRNNFRPVQKLNSRSVYLREEPKDVTEVVGEGEDETLNTEEEASIIEEETLVDGADDFNFLETLATSIISVLTFSLVYTFLTQPNPSRISKESHLLTQTSEVSRIQNYIDDNNFDIFKNIYTILKF